MTFKEQFTQLAHLLQHDERFEVRHCEIGQDPSEFDWDELLASTSLEGMSFPQLAGDILRDINGFHLEWIVKPNVHLIPYDTKHPEELFGRIWLYDPADLIEMYILGHWKETLTHHAQSDNPEEPLNLIPFDYYHPDYSGCACFQIEDHAFRNSVTIHNSQFGFYYTPLNFEQYLSLLVASGGLLGAREGFLMPEGTERAKLLHYIPLLFPKSSIQDLVAQFDATHP